MFTADFAMLTCFALSFAALVLCFQEFFDHGRQWLGRPTSRPAATTLARTSPATIFRKEAASSCGV